MENYNELINKIPESLYTQNSGSDITKLFSLYSEVFNDMKSVVDDIALLRDISTQKGIVLDEIGKIVKEPRRNLSDENYRGYLHIAILRNRSNGSLKTISQLAELITGSETYTIRELQKLSETSFNGMGKFSGKRLLNPGNNQPAAFEVILPEGIDETYFNGLMKEVTSGGVKLST